MNCTAETCGQPTDLYLCWDCIAELGTHMAKIPDLLPVLAMITRKEEQPFTVRANRGGGKPGPTTPLDLAAHALWETLNYAAQNQPDDYARDADAANIKERIQDAIHRADMMVNGEDEQTVTVDYLNFRMTQIPALPAKEIPEWFRDQLGIEITHSRIRKWVTRGFLTATNNDRTMPKYHPKDVLNVLNDKEKAA